MKVEISLDTDNAEDVQFLAQCFSIFGKPSGGTVKFQPCGGEVRKPAVTDAAKPAPEPSTEPGVTVEVELFSGSKAPADPPAATETKTKKRTRRTKAQIEADKKAAEQGAPTQDTSTTTGADTPAVTKVDTPAVTKVDTPAVTKVDTPAVTKVDTPAVTKVDTPATYAGPETEAEPTPACDCTIEEVRAAIMECAKKHNPERAVTEVFMASGVRKTSEIPPELFGKVTEQLRKSIAGA